ncbi:MAG: class B sortase [Lachnospiraceae bacterium]|nr:class B sortase [Lachnospiraceae bacterium]
MKSINKKVIGIAVAAAGILAAAFLLLWPAQENKETEEIIQQVAHVSDPVQETQEKEAEASEDTPEEEELSVEFKALKKMNPDIVAWIEVDGTDISYPVLQSSPDEPEDYYLKHDVNKAENKYGAIYMQKRNARDFTDFMTVIYGHNMRDGSMFRQLHNFRDDMFLQNHKKIVIHLPKEKKEYEIISVQITTAENILDTYDDFTDPDIAEAYWHRIVGKSDPGHLLVLSTCCGEDNKRLLVTAIEK